MLVGFTGAGATGKSTVLNAIRDIPRCPPILTSVARRVFAERGLKTEADQDALSPAARWDLQMHIFEEQWKLEASLPSYVTERTSLCRLVYTVFRNATHMTDSQWIELGDRVERDMRKYDALFYFPIAPFNLTDDGFRQGGQSYNWCLDSMIRTFLADRGIPFVDVGRTTVAERVKMVTAVLFPGGHSVDVMCCDAYLQVG